MLPNKYYHIYNHANGEENLYSNEENYCFFLRKFAEYINPVADTFAYCLMPNHFHLLIQIKSEELLREAAREMNKFSFFKKADKDITEFNYILFVSQQFSHFLNSYTQAFNKCWERKGSLMRPNFKRKEIIDENYFTRLIYYIHLNPVHHCFAKEVSDWKFSSYNTILSTKPTSLKRAEVLEYFGGKEEYIRFHQQPVSEEIRKEFDL